ncbi:MAG: hypothetical protein E7390_06695 [Ruminococcaceae bacterium]|nr:hypothetical protein [Oscillospiraceae bacterium]
MIKFLLATLIISGFWCLGQSKNARMRARLAGLWQFSDGLQAMESEIRGVCAPLPVAFEAAGRSCPLFTEAARLCGRESAEDAFFRAVTATAPEAEEAEIFRSFAAGLSAGETAGQLANIDRCRTRLDTLIKRLEGDVTRLGRLYSKAGVLAGLLVVILLF